MRLNKEIAKLDADKGAVVFPKWSQSFDRYRAKFLAVLSENGLSFEGWEWNEYEQNWSTTHHEFAAIGTFQGQLKRNVHLDPKLPLADEIERLTRESAAFKAACFRSVREQELAQIVKENA